MYYFDFFSFSFFFLNWANIQKLITIHKSVPELFVCLLQLNAFDLYLQILQIFDPSCVPSAIQRPLMKQKPSYNKKHSLILQINFR